MLFGSKVSREYLLPASTLAAASALLLLASCGSGGDGPTNSNASITNGNNYMASGTLDVPHATTAPGADLNVCWPGVTKDLLCHEVDPTKDILAATFLRIPNLTEKEITDQLTSGTFDQGVVDLYVTFKVAWEPGSTCAPLSKFKLGGKLMDPAKDYVVDPKYKYMLLFAASEVAGAGTKSMVFLDPSEGSQTKQVDAPSGCGVLSFNADLTTPQPVGIPAAGPWNVEWASLTKDGLGNPVTFTTIDSLMVGFYAMSVAELQAKALDYDRIATVLYQVPIVDGATSADLASAKTSDGKVFSGFAPPDGAEGFWAVGLLCSECQIPAPIAVAILNPT